MKRILYVTDTLMSGGVERQLVELVTRLDRSRFEPRVLALYGERAGRSLHFAGILREHRVPVHVLDLGWGPLDKVRGAAGILQSTWALRPYAVHALNYHANLLTRLARPFMLPSTRLVGTIRNAATPKQLLYERLSWRMCVVMVCNSPHLRAQLMDQAGVPADRVVTILNGVDTDRFAPADSRPPWPPRRLLMIGRISLQKAPALLADAVGELKTVGRLPNEVRVSIVGEPFHQQAQAELDASIQRYGLNKVIAQEPASERPEALYHAADLLVLPSLFEGLPNVVLEALASGLPVLVSDAANAGGVVEHGVTGWVFPSGDVWALAETLAQALNTQPARLSDMRAACRQAAGRYSLREMVAAYEALYARLRAKPSTDT